jgi:hypothetical protein
VWAFSPEAKERENLTAVFDWVVQSRDEANITDGWGVAIREFPLKPGFGEQLKPVRGSYRKVADSDLRWHTASVPSLNFKGKALVQNFHLLVPYHELKPVKSKSLTPKGVTPSRSSCASTVP